MLGSLILGFIVFVLVFMIIVVKTEGFKLTIATIGGAVGLTWAFFIDLWSNFKEIVIIPAIDTIFGATELNFLTFSITMLFISWVFILAVAIINIIITANKGSVKIFENLTENKNDNL